MGLIHMAPNLAIDNPADLRLGYTEFPGDVTLTSALVSLSANLPHNLIRQLRISVPLSLLDAAKSSAFGVHVLGIFFLCACKEMARIDARRIITSVTRTRFRPIAIRQKESDSMGLVLDLGMFEAPVFPGSPISGYPEPAGIGSAGSINFEPETGDGRMRKHLALLTLGVMPLADPFSAGVSIIAGA